MKILYLFFILVNSEKIITNINIPSCRNCLHYKPPLYSNDFSYSLSKCEKFGEKDIVTNKITYMFAESCRNDESKCGKIGKYYEKEINIEIKILNHLILSNMPNFLLTTFTCIFLSCLFFSEFKNNNPQ
jgi:hypothetical protein